MKRKLLTLCSILLIGGVALAQQGDGGNPRTLKEQLSKSVDSRVFTEPNIAALKAEDAINDIERNGPWRFGENHYTDFNFSNSGTWTSLTNGGKIWQIKLT